MKSVLKFIKSNKVLTVGVIISFTIFLSYELTMDWPEIIPYGDFIFNLASQLSLAYMGSFIFYIMQVYIPEVRNKKILNSNIKRKLFLILNRMETLIKYLSNTYISKDDIAEITNEDCKVILENINILEEAPMVDSFGNHVTLLRYIKEYVYSSEKFINELYDTMILYLEPELIEILDNIKESVFNCMFRSMAESNTPEAIIQNGEENFIYQYCKLYLKLKKYHDLF